MRVKISLKVKYGLILILTIIGMVIGFDLIKNVTFREYVTLYDLKYKYTNQLAMNYKVHLKENDVFEEEYLGEGLYYSKLLFDCIEIKVDEVFCGTQQAQLDGTYEIVAKVRGYTTSNGEKMEYWSKTYPLIQKQEVSIKQDKWTKHDMVKVRLEEYEQFAMEAKKTTGYEVAAEVVISVRGNLKAVTNDGELTCPLSGEITIPLQKDVFQIEKRIPEPSSDELKESYQERVPKDWKKIMLLTVTLFGIVGMIYYFAFLTIQPTKKDELQKKIEKILINYGTRIVSIESVNVEEINEVYEVSSIEDLIKIEDEIEKPIFYIRPENGFQEGITFQLIDEGILYRCQIGEK